MSPRHTSVLTLLLAVAALVSCAEVGSAWPDAVVAVPDTPEPTVTPTKPYNFSWVVDFKLAGMAYPGKGSLAESQAAYLAELNVRLLVSLTPGMPDLSAFEAAGMSILHLPVKDFTAPTLDQLESFVAAVGEALDSGGAVTVHCGAGLGRTGTMLAAWLISRGATAAEAIAAIRAARPGSIETPTQEAVLVEFEALVSGAGGTD